MTEAIGTIAEALDWICAERLQPALCTMPLHRIFGRVAVCDAMLEILECISVATQMRALKELCLGSV